MPILDNSNNHIKPITLERPFSHPTYDFRGHKMGFWSMKMDIFEFKDDFHAKKWGISEMKTGSKIEFELFLAQNRSF